MAKALFILALFTITVLVTFDESFAFDAVLQEITSVLGSMTTGAIVWTWEIVRRRNPIRKRKSKTSVE